ncbi:MAG: Homoserine/Threonine efflux protein [Candidatus Tokpelaia sp. JSC189]|nr:MAG: Homoserine/Threonine efflux protein [Candidatus Tokpelaia sp. JSC189]
MQPYFVEFSTLISIFISLGADLAMIIRQVLVYGRKNVRFTAFRTVTVLIIRVTYTILRFDFIISRWLSLFDLIKSTAVIYLIYIGIKALCAKGTMLAVTAENMALLFQLVHNAFLVAFTIDMLNRKAVLFFLSIFVVAAKSAQVKCRLWRGDGRADLICQLVCAYQFLFNDTGRRRFYVCAAK